MYYSFAPWRDWRPWFSWCADHQIPNRISWVSWNWCCWWIILGDLSMNKDIRLDRSGHLLGRKGFPRSYLNSKAFPLPWSFAAGLSLGPWLGYSCVPVLAFVSYVTIWALAADSADNCIKITISLLPCDLEAWGTTSLHLLSFSALTARPLHTQEWVWGLSLWKALKVDFSCTTSRAYCFLSLGIPNTLSCQFKRGD